MKGKYIKKEKKINTKSLQPQKRKREQIHWNGASENKKLHEDSV